MSERSKIFVSEIFLRSNLYMQKSTVRVAQYESNIVFNNIINCL